MSERTDGDLLSDILEAARRIKTYTDALTFDRFQADSMTQDAVIRNLEIIGEATMNLSAEIRGEHTDIPWKNMAGVRNRLIHHYFGVNLDIVWNIVSVELSALESQIVAIRKKEDKDGCDGESSEV